MSRTALAAPIPSMTRTRMSCLLVAPLDPLTGELRAGPLRRFLNPPANVAYSLATDRFRYPQRAAQYTFDPAFVGLATVRFVLEHSRHFEQRGHALAHSFFLDLQRFVLPWVHESDQAFGQFLSDYMHIKGYLKRRATELFSSYLNSNGCRSVIAWSQWAKRGFVEDGVDRSKIHVIPPPFETVVDRRPHTGCNILFIGRDFTRKGGDIALNAFCSIPRSEDCRLIYVGKVNEPTARKVVSNDSRIVHLVSPTSRTLREDVWPITDVFLLPTRADAFAISAVEAMCRGIPVIATKLPALTEMVKDQVSGLLASPNDAQAFSRYVQRLVQDEEARCTIGEEAKKVACRMFSPNIVNQAL